MYAHKVIESLDILNKKGDSSRINKKLLLFVKGKVLSSQKFKIGEFVDFAEVFQKNLSEFNVGFDHDFKRPPYDTLWIDFMLQGVKQGLLCIVNNERRTGNLIPFIEDKDVNAIWVPQIHKFSFLIDSEDGAGIAPNPLFFRDDYYDRIKKNQLKLQLNTASVFCLLNKFLSCRNIEVVDDPPPEKLNKKRTKKGKQPLFTYKTLIIKPAGKHQKSIPKHLWENRIHLCRGHFKTYTADAPLFGKYTGRYWWQPSVKGRNKKGVVMKDYEVTAE